MRIALGERVRRRWPELLLGACYVAADLSLSLAGRPQVAVFNDSVTYLHPSLTGGTGRLWFVPVVFWLAGSNEARVLAQTIVGAGCWLVLAAAAATALRGRAARLVAFAVVLLLALMPEVVQWNRAILSESLAISATAALLAASIWLVRRPTWWSLGAWLVAVLLWTFSRQVQALIVGVLVVPLLVAAVRVRGRRAMLVAGAGAVAAIAAWGTVASLQAGSIARFNAIAIVRYRAETHPAELRFFESHGLPMVAPLRSPIPFRSAGLPVDVSQHADPADMTRLLADPVLVHWVDRHWDGVYAAYLLQHPGADLGPPVAEAPVLMTTNPGYVDAPSVPSWLQDALYGAAPAYLVALFAVAAAGFALTAWRRRSTAFLWLLAGALVFDYAWCAAVWNLSASELPRLYDPEAVVAHVGLVLLVVAVADRWLVRVRAPEPSPSDPGPGAPAAADEVLVASTGPAER